MRAVTVILLAATAAAQVIPELRKKYEAERKKP
jgi:hypothetical protein